MSAFGQQKHLVARRCTRSGCGHLFVVLTLVVTLQGCTHVTIVDREGAVSVIGLVWMTLPPPKGDASAAQTLRTRSLGLAATHSELGSTAVLGYGDSTFAFIRDDRLVAADALMLRGKELQQDPEEKIDETSVPKTSSTSP